MDDLDVSVDSIFDQYVPEETPAPEVTEEVKPEEGGEVGDEEEQDSSSEDGEEKDGDKEGGEDASSDEEEVLEEEDEELAALEKEIKAEAPNLKKIKAKKGTEEVELEEDIVIPTKVDGKLEEVSLKDLRASYSSKVHNHREFRKLEGEKKQFFQAREQFDGVIRNFAQKTKQGAVVPAVMDLIAATGEDPIPIINNIREGLVESGAELFGMTKEERQALYKAESAGYYQQQTARLREQQATEAQNQVLQQQIARVVSEYGIPDQETFLETVPKANQYLTEAKAKGQVGQDVTLTPEMVAKFYQAEKLRNTFHEAIREVAPMVKEGSAEYERFANWVALNKPNRERIVAAARKIFGSNGNAKPEAKKPTEKAKPRKERASVTSKDDDSVDLSEFGWEHLR